MEKIYKNNLSIWFYFNILITFQLINIAKSQLINNIIKLGENNFTSIFWAKQNGKFYFKNSNNSKTPYYLMKIDHEKWKNWRESSIINLSSNDIIIHEK